MDGAPCKYKLMCAAHIRMLFKCSMPGTTLDVSNSHICMLCATDLSGVNKGLVWCFVADWVAATLHECGGTMPCERCVTYPPEEDPAVEVSRGSQAQAHK